jgi:hypothetical protein
MRPGLLGLGVVGIMALSEQSTPRAHGVWQRRPDVVAIALGSPGIDVAGEVCDLHQVIELVADSGSA